jgi:putative transposase
MNQIKTYRFKLNPTKAQAQSFAQWLGSCRYVYNLCLDYKKQLYANHSISISKNDIQKEVAGIAKEVDWIGQVHSQTLQEVTDRLFKAYDGFFKSGKGFPQLAKKGQYASFTFKQGVKLHQNTNTVQPPGGPVPKIGKVKYRKSQTVDGIIKTANISKQADGWYISLVCQVAINPLPINPNTVGLDVGIQSFLVSSDGEVIDNPKYLYQYQKRLTKAPRSVSRKKKAGSNRKKAVQKLGKIHLKIRNTRKDFQHKLSTQLIRENPGGEPQTIVVEDLKVSNLLKNHKLAKAIADCGWYGFTQMLEYKAKWYGRTFIRVAPQYTSQACSVCGCRNSELTLKDRQWTAGRPRCSSCHTIHDRNVNAATNIKYKAVGNNASAWKIYAPNGVVVQESLAL